MSNEALRYYISVCFPWTNKKLQKIEAQLNLT